MTVRVLRHRLGGSYSAAEVFRVLHGDDSEVFWLDGGECSYVGAGEAWYPGPGSGEAGVLADVQQELAEPGAPMLGLVGWFGYELLAETVGVDAPSLAVVRRSRGADAAFLRVTRMVAVTAGGSAELVAAGERWEGELGLWRRDVVTRLAEVEARGERVDGEQHEGAPRTVSWRESDEEYLANIASCQEAIRAGEAYVLNLTTEARVAGAFDPVAVYDRLRADAPSEHGALLRIGGVSLLSSSPELFVDVEPGGGVRTSPVKGTRARAEHPEADRAAADELGADPKERAENTMIVDLMRNDFARVCVLGSVRVVSLLEVQTQAQVHQLVSSIEGRLRPGLGVVDLLRAAFPAGSMTGAPKRSAIEILDRLEGRARGLYAGAFGFLGVDEWGADGRRTKGRAELAMTIRSIVIEGDAATVGVGGGVTALSDPQAELAEMKLKAAALLRALGADIG
ncbi:hypothetical protein B7R21_08350 [Subtercola boreus]|uniref:Chorismate-utilising enzyme C-terminal domain-containing protein n=1 Tax=Subtercola boreus TaxID=120213 RepID=A0A3E0VUD5_9MICO|nr:anthranilate synthase component I family protein [Subtercola boreus]RFA13361.1 hypothetical protein B7R21_08350 [Subtercola boreus]